MLKVSNNTTSKEQKVVENLLSAIRGHQLAATIHLAARWRIPDAVGEGCSIDNLASQLLVNRDALHRMLRALAAFEIFEVSKEGFVSQSAASRLLMKDSARSLHAAAMFWGMPCFWPAWGDLDYSIRTGESSFENRAEMKLFDYLSGNSYDCAVFDEFMGSSPDQRHEAIAQAYSFDKFRTIADIGGGNGQQLATILAETPATNGILYDRPDVIKGAVSEIGALEQAGRCSVVAGDFFDAVPIGADAYVLSQIIHDWDDAAALRILKNCKVSMKSDGVLLLIERVVDPDADNLCTGSFLSDMEMLVLHGSAERSTEQYQILLEAGGFSLQRVILTSCPFSIIEAVPR